MKPTGKYRVANRAAEADGYQYFTSAKKARFVGRLLSRPVWAEMVDEDGVLTWELFNG